MALKNLIPRARVPKATPMTKVKLPVPVIVIAPVGGMGKKSAKKGKK